MKHLIKKYEENIYIKNIALKKSYNLNNPKKLFSANIKK